MPSHNEEVHSVASYIKGMQSTIPEGKEHEIEVWCVGCQKWGKPGSPRGYGYPKIVKNLSCIYCGDRVMTGEPHPELTSVYIYKCYKWRCILHPVQQAIEDARKSAGIDNGVPNQPYNT